MGHVLFPLSCSETLVNYGMQKICSELARAACFLFFSLFSLSHSEVAGAKVFLGTILDCWRSLQRLVEIGYKGKLVGSVVAWVVWACRRVGPGLRPGGGGLGPQCAGSPESLGRKFGASQDGGEQSWKVVVGSEV
jgi:hypothetical protein